MRWIVLVAVIVLSTVNVAWPHGWYDSWCCSDHDCHPAPNAQVEMTPDGYKVTPEPGGNTYLIPLSGRRDSQDGDYHVCITSYGEPRCLYVPVKA